MLFANVYPVLLSHVAVKELNVKYSAKVDASIDMIKHETKRLPNYPHIEKDHYLFDDIRVPSGIQHIAFQSLRVPVFSIIQS